MASKEYWRARYEKDFKPAYDALMKFYPFTLEDLDGEEWKTVPWCEDYYVSNFGRIMSLKYKRPRIMKPALNGHGYLFVELHKDNKTRIFLIARLVAELFVPNPGNLPQVDHRYGMKFDNSVDNLRWVSGSENMKHAFELGLAKNDVGSDDSQAKLTDEQVYYIRENSSAFTIYELAEIFNVSPTTILRVQRGLSYTNAKGFIRGKKSKPLKVTYEERKKIKAEYVKGKITQYQLAEKYSVNQATICRIIKTGYEKSRG